MSFAAAHEPCEDGVNRKKEYTQVTLILSTYITHF